MIKNNKILIAKVASVFGIKGEVAVTSFCGTAKDIEKYQIFDQEGNLIKLKISKNKNSNQENQNLIMTIDGVSTRELAEQWRNKEFFVNREDFKKPAEDEFYYIDLIGLDVVNVNLEKIGKVLDVRDHGAGGIIEIDFFNKEAGQLTDFPFNKEIFPKVSINDGFVSFVAPEIIKAE